MPERMTKLNNKSYLGWIAEKTLYTTEYALFENTYNANVDFYNRQFDGAGGDEKDALDSERLKINTCTAQSRYDDGLKVLARWKALFPAMRRFFTERDAFAGRDLSEHDDVEEKYTKKLDGLNVKDGTYQKGADQIRSWKTSYAREIESRTVEGLDAAFDDLGPVIGGGKKSFVAQQHKLAKDDDSEDGAARTKFGEMAEVLQRFAATQAAQQEYDDAADRVSEPIASAMDALRPDMPSKVISEEDYQAVADGIDDLETFAAQVPAVIAYTDAAERADAAMRLAYNPDSAVKPSGARAKRQAERVKAFAAARTKAEKGAAYADAAELMESLILQLENDNKNYVAGVGKQATSDLAGKKQAGMLKLLAGKTDLNGQDMLTALTEAFGPDKIAELLAAADQIGDAEDPKKETASANLAKLVGTLGAAGLKSLGAGLAGDTAPLEGVKHAAGLMKHGMDEDQLAAMVESYDGADLQAVFATGFNADTELFASIVGSGLGGSVTHLKSLTDAFGDKAALSRLLAGLAAPDPSAPGGEKQKAGTRMNNLLTNRFTVGKTVRPEKLKTPFFDTLDGMAQAHADQVAEMRRLSLQKTAFDDFQKLTREQQDGTNPKPAALTKKEGDRLDLLIRTVDPARVPTPVATLIRNAATFSVKTPSATDKSPPQSGDLNGARCTSERVEHFLTRHTRAHFPFGGDALASETTSLASVDHKPATMWPDGTTAADLKSYLSAALKAIRPPGPGDFAGTNFLRENTSIRVGGRNVPVRLGFEKKGAQVVLTQFYPKKGAGLDTISFEDLHGIKKALGKP